MPIKTDFKFDANNPFHDFLIKSPKNALAHAGLDYTTIKEPAINEGATRFHFLRAGKNGPVLDVVGNDYKPTQNADVWEFITDFAKKGGARCEVLGSMHHHRIVFALLNLGDTYKVKDGSNITPYLFVGIPHMRGKSLIARVTTRRDVCNNTMHIAMRTDGRGHLSDVFRMNHRNTFNPVQQDKARQILDLASESVEQFASRAGKLMNKKFSIDDANKVFDTLFPSDDKRSRKSLAVEQAYTNAPGALPGNAWGVLNAVTYYVDHMAGKSPDRRLAQAQIGRGAVIKQKALALVSA